MTGSTRKAKDNDNFGEQFVSDHIDAEIEFYWALKITVEMPKNKILTGLSQHFQRDIIGQLLVGVLRRGEMELSHSYNYRDMCMRSPNEILLLDQFGNGYTGKQFLSIVSASYYN